MKLAFVDAYAHIADRPLPAQLFDDAHLDERRSLISPTQAGSPSPTQLADAEPPTFASSTTTAWLSR